MHLHSSGQNRDRFAYVMESMKGVQIVRWLGWLYSSQEKKMCSSAIPLKIKTNLSIFATLSCTTINQYHSPNWKKLVFSLKVYL